MSKKAFYWICGILMTISMVLGITGRFLNPQDEMTTITMWTLVLIFAVNPLFYFGLGGICAARLFPKPSALLWRRLLLIAGTVLTLILCFVGAAEILGHPVKTLFFQIFRQLFRYPGFFLAPGIFLGMGLFED